LVRETSRYEVLERQGPFEIRRYSPLILAETYVEGDLAPAGLEGYRRLVSYISGDNRARREIECTTQLVHAKGPRESGPPPEHHRGMRGERIAMTAPMAQSRCGTGYCISFVMPSRYTLITLPQPSNPNVTLRELPERIVAAVRYRGSWRPALFARRQAELEGFMARRGLKAAGAARFARYNPPYVPWFLRRNEVLIPVTEYPPL
jgi:hypothetical protein